ncbi:MAG TPA: AAA family ATPase, partial [Firmicutes bacterium]|nr:AAA family ATPase [Bacillota bacterium]
MKLRGWHIDGFGIFRDVGVDDIADGVTVFLGPNESGKTTLLEFLRRMLFGFPDRRKRVNLYEPLRGGRHGGRVFVEGDEGVYTIERYSGHAGARRAFRITRPDGGEGGEEDLSRLLGGVDEKLFCNIFAFGLAELTRLDTLAGQEIRERITSAGISGAGAPAAEALKELQAMQVSILRSGRRTPSQSSLMRRDDSINGVVECLKETIRQREEAEGLARRYRELLEAESEISERIESLERQIEKARLRAEAADRATSLALRRLSGALGDFEAAVDKALYACTKALQQQEDAEREIEAYSPRPIPRWVQAACWALALALAVTSALKFTHGNPG